MGLDTAAAAGGIVSCADTNQYIEFTILNKYQGRRIIHDAVNNAFFKCM